MIRKTIRVCLIIAFFLANFVIAEAQSTIIYEDGTKNNGRVEWTRTVESHDAEIGVAKKFSIPIKNISKDPLKILSAKTHCGCIEAEAPSEVILPGEIGYVKATFTAKPRYNGDMSVPPPFTFYQIIDVTTNFDSENAVLLSVQGTVIK